MATVAEPMSLVRRVAPLGFIVAVAVVGLGFLIVHPEGLFNRYSDLLAYHLGAQTVLHQSWTTTHGLPLWRPDMLSGGPALTNPQSLYTHPLHVLFLFFRPERVVGLVIWLQMLLAGLGGYYAGAALRLSISSRLLVAVATLFSFKTILIVYAGGLTAVAGLAALPLLFGSVLSALERPSWRSALALGGAGAMSLHTGQLQLVYYAALFSAVGSLVWIARLLITGDRRKGVKVASSLGLGLIVAAGLSAYLLLPLAHNAALITRSGASYDFFVGNNPHPPIALLTLFNPELFGTPLDGSFVEAWEHVVYCGAATSLLAVAGAVRGRKRLVVKMLVAGLLVSVALSVQTPLLRFAYTFVPGYSLFRLPARILFLSVFFAFCLAGVGLEEVLSTIRDRRSRRTMAALAIGLVVLEGSAWAWRYLRERDPIPAVVPANYLLALAGDGQLFRVAPLARSIPNYGSAASLGLQLVTGYDPFNMRDYQTYIDFVQRDEAVGIRATNWTDLEGITRFDMLAALNVLYVVSPKRLDVPATEYVLIGSFENQPQFRFYQGLVPGPVYVYLNRRFLRRAFFVSQVLTAADEDAMRHQVQGADLRETAIVETTAGGISAATADDRIDIVGVTTGRLELATRNAKPRFLVVSETWHPGWGARVDGRRVPLHRTDIALQGLWLEPGDHRIELRYWPPGLTLGLVLSGITLLGVLVLLVFMARRPDRTAA